MNTSKKVLLSGVKPTGKLHIGNYFGAVKQFIDMQDTYDNYVFIADYHAMTTVQNADTMKQNIIDLAASYLAAGLKPENVCLFKQSDIAEVFELGWIFNCITTMPYLERAHAYKDAMAKNKEINVGTFDYPMLMAADILIQDADVVPVGLDQKQHVEYARDTAEKFNRIFGQAFKMPEPILIKDLESIRGTDGQKMSKSYNNTIELFATYEELKKVVMSIPTDSKGVADPKNPDECNVFALHKLFATSDELSTLGGRYIKGEIGYKESKEILLASMERMILPIREKKNELLKNPSYIISLLEEGAKIAKERAVKKMNLVRKLVGTDIK
jgi:tryptophanyl-tRNA synthetase